MKLKNIHGFANIDEYVRYKTALYSEKEKSFESLFELMFDESENIMVETTDGYRIHKITYGEFKKKILAAIPSVANHFSALPQGAIIGLYMANCPEWLLLFWAILGAGFRPLLMNTRLPDEVLNGLLKEYQVGGVISDGALFEVKTILKDDALAPCEMDFKPRPFGEEILFMSSGTSGQVKLCAYTGENFYYQIRDSANIITNCPEIKRHYDGQIKQLMLLPLCHVFGFIAVYLWFGFFSRTFVFPKDLNPATIQRTVQKHKVTHIFAVPMVWERVAKAVVSKIKGRGEKTYRRFLKVSALVNSLGKSGDFLAKRLLSEVREGLFGDSICFLISGGSEISASTLQFFNGIGYHLANGYGMTEIGITSVEPSSDKKILNSGSIGFPFGNTAYRLDEEGMLWVRGKTRASRILCGGEEKRAKESEWFKTGDIMQVRDGRYYACGRADDLIIFEDGENLNPALIEPALLTEGVEKLCLFIDEQKRVCLIASVPGCYAKESLLAIKDALEKRITDAKLEQVIRRIFLTHEPLLSAGEFKLSRQKIAERIKLGSLRAFDPVALAAHSEELFEELEAQLRLCFARALEKDPAEIGKDTHFFRDLGGTSLDYFGLLNEIRAHLGAEITESDAVRPATIRQFADLLQKQTK